MQLPLCRGLLNPAVVFLSAITQSVRRCLKLSTKRSVKSLESSIPLSAMPYGNQAQGDGTMLCKWGTSVSFEKAISTNSSMFYTLPVLVVMARQILAAEFRETMSFCRSGWTTILEGVQKDTKNFSRRASGWSLGDASSMPYGTSTCFSAIDSELKVRII